MELRKELELIDVETQDKKASLIFLDKEKKEIRTVSFNKKVYKDGKYVDDKAKAEQVEGWCKEYFGKPFDKLKDCIGQKHDIYVYDNFCALWECDVVEKFQPDQVGQLYQTKIKEIKVDDMAIRIRYEVDKKTYESKMSFAYYMEATKEWFVDPQKKIKQLEKFKTKFGVPIAEAESLVGHDLIVEVKAAFGVPYGDVKAFPKN